MCLATVVFLESRGESIEGQMAVAEVVMNRVKHSDFPTTVCEVASEEYQFSYKEGLDSKVIDTISYEAAYEVYTCGSGLTGGALFFHTKSTKPYWSKHFKYTVTIGNHKFYTLKENDN